MDHRNNYKIIYEDNHCLALNKPAGLLTQGDITGEPSLLELARDDVRTRYAKPGNVYLGLLHRLDRPVSGVVLLAKTSKAAGRLSAQFRDGTVRKVYWAVVEGRPLNEDGEWSDVLRKDASRNVVEVVQPGASGAKEARLLYRVLERGPRTTRVELRPLTGRSHQLRVQLASRGLPIVGDRKYGARCTLRASDGGPRIALHARELTFIHPTRREAISVVAPVPADWPATGPGR
jgi:23S rRNA pseudouridine1911/1915/1917 synthase